MNRVSAVFFAAMFTFAAACGTVKSVKKGTPAQDRLAMIDGDENLRDAANEGEVYVTENGAKVVGLAGLATVRFELDSSNLTPEGRLALKANAAVLKRHPKVQVEIAGHADPRGTTEYNLALGQKRAAVVSEYYKKLGVRAARLESRSFGEERPLCSEESESCWSANRRAGTEPKVKSLFRD